MASITEVRHLTVFVPDSISDTNFSLMYKASCSFFDSLGLDNHSEFPLVTVNATVSSNTAIQNGTQY